MKTKKKNTSPTITADKIDSAASVTETAMIDESTVPKIPKNNPPLLHFMQDFNFEPHFAAADEITTVNKNTIPVTSATSAAVNGAVRMEVTKSATAAAAAMIPLMIPTSTIIPVMHSEHSFVLSFGQLQLIIKNSTPIKFIFLSEYTRILFSAPINTICKNQTNATNFPYTDFIQK